MSCDLRLTILAAAAFLLAAPSWAKEAAATSKPAAQNIKKHERMFNEGDANADGFLTQEEMLAIHRKRVQKIFETADMDKDGKLSRAEMDVHHQKMSEMMRKRFQKKDGAGQPKPPHAPPAE